MENFDPSIKEDAYVYNRLTNEERNEYNKKYNQYMLAQANSSEEKIIEILKKYLPAYKCLYSATLQTSEQKYKTLKTKYENLQTEKNKLIKSSAYMFLEKNILEEYLKEDFRTAKSKKINGTRENEAHLRCWVEKQVDNFFSLFDEVNHQMEKENLNEPPVVEMTIGKNYLIEINVFDFIEHGKSILAYRTKNPVKNMSREKAERFLDWATKKDAENEQALIAIDNDIKTTTKEILKIDLKDSKKEIKSIEHDMYVYTENMNINSGFGNKLKAYLEYGEKTPFKEKLEKSLNAGKNAEYRQIRGYYQLHSPLVVKHLMDDLANGKIKLPEKQLGTEME